jgi:regulator of protease activity HflC (stomatin/prohibitin superfamily)
MDRYLLTILLSVLAFITLIALARSARVVAQYEKGLVLRLGRYRTTVDSGLTFLVPVIEDMLKVDMRERVINVEPQKVITKDNVSVTVDAVIYYRIIDPVKATFEVQHFAYAATTLAQTNLRNLIGDKSLDETLTARDTINANLRSVLDEATNTWGVKVTRVEVQKIDPPADITEAMSRQMKAERDKRAQILESEGLRQAAILKAEGEKQAVVLAAEGKKEAAFREAEARERFALAEAEATRMVSEAISAGNVQAINYFVANNYVKALEAIARSPNQKILMMPMEASAVIGSLGGLAEIAREAFGNQSSSGNRTNGSGSNVPKL